MLIRHPKKKKKPPEQAKQPPKKSRMQPKEIMVNGNRYQVGWNLYQVLEHIAKKLYEQDAKWEARNRWWIDAICIDQNNDAEKEAQLRIMRHIYASAAEVIAWVGPGNPNTNPTMRVLQSIEQETFLSIFKSKPYERSRIFHTLEDLFNRPYWTRVWILQELAVSRNTRLVCGEGELDWMQLVRIATWTSIAGAEFDPKTVRRIEFGVSRHHRVWLLSLMYKDKEWRKTLDMAKLVYMSQRSKATNKRDHIRALLGMLDSGYSALPSSIDGSHDSSAWSACAIVCQAIRRMLDDMRTKLNYEMWNSVTVGACTRITEQCCHRPLSTDLKMCKKRAACNDLKCGALEVCRRVAAKLYRNRSIYSIKLGGRVVHYNLH